MCTVRTLTTTAALGFCVFLVALVVSVVEASHRPAAQPMPTSAVVTVVDVAPGVDAGTLASLVRLRADERIVAVDDRPVVNDLAAGAAISARALAAGTYLDLTVAGATGSRRVLVLMH